MRKSFTNTAIRGFLTNPYQKPPLVLRFQWNPVGMTESKSAKYTDLEIGGYHAPVQIYSSGGAHTYRFSLLFDATPDSVDLNVLRVDTVLVGVQPAVQTLMSFVYPETKSLLSFSESGFGEPPVCYFGMGPRVLRGFIKTVDVDTQLLNVLLVPVRVSCRVEFVESEDGTYGKVNAIYRRAMTALQLGRNI